MSVPIKVVLAEPSTVIRSGLAAVLKQGPTAHWEVFEIDRAEQINPVLCRQKPAIFIVNPNFLGAFSLSQIKKTAAAWPMSMVALQSSLTDGDILRAYDEVISIYDSLRHIEEKLTALVRRPEKDKRHESLSAREKEIVVGIINGLTNKQIADKLCLSVHTVITHRRNISAKLQIHSTAGLTMYALLNKLVDLE
jgi:DNA-binding NarL/FixJ family response regulator